MNVRILEKDDYKKMKELFFDVFSNEPWFDQWNEEQLDLYMKDLMDNNNSLSWGTRGYKGTGPLILY
ncbi:hypothetical protein [Pallidibacillus pasinlerensis]|uniref:hypothetical protein n=1 Tax=Pallidibacillus pasinlerensis TaxID=2703818 RepID=UPI00192A6410|nr:hypothetical protein [Pallidibacillus pasinlerensis]